MPEVLCQFLGMQEPVLVHRRIVLQSSGAAARIPGVTQPARKSSSKSSVQIPLAQFSGDLPRVEISRVGVFGSRGLAVGYGPSFLAVASYHTKSGTTLKPLAYVEIPPRNPPTPPLCTI